MIKLKIHGAVEIKGTWHRTGYPFVTLLIDLLGTDSLGISAMPIKLILMGY